MKIGIPSFRDVLALHMRRNGLDHRTLAEKSTVSEATVSRILADENYTPGAKTIERIAHGLGLARVSEIWENPFEPLQQERREEIETRRIVVLAELTDPDFTFTIDGKPLNDVQRQSLQLAVDILRLSTK